MNSIFKLISAFHQFLTKNTRLKKICYSSLLLTTFHLAGCISPIINEAGTPTDTNIEESPKELQADRDKVVGWIAAQHRLTIDSQQSNQFTHLIVTNQAFQSLRGTSEKQKTLYIFIEGDGLAWVDGKINRDPTPSYPLMLRLMTLTQSPALYLGRPCYFQTLSEPIENSCHPRYWTSHRYSSTIANSLLEILGSTAAEYSHWVFIGHSGGGTLALLMALAIEEMRTLPMIDQEIQTFTVEQMPVDTTVVTLSGNIDIHAWTDHHRYSLLNGSLNPAENGNLSRIRQMHFLGEYDKKIPPKLVLPTLSTHALKYEIINAVDHNCCWHLTWPTVENWIKRTVKE